MRWIWIDRIIELERGVRCIAVKNISLAEEVLHDHFPATDNHPAMPVLPNPLILEGMAQTAGILVGHANDFREKVILAKVGRARFTEAAWPGYCLRYTAEVVRLDGAGASTHGHVERLDPHQPHAAPVPLAEIELLFSHIDQARTGLDLPEHNFVFTRAFLELVSQSGVDLSPSKAPQGPEAPDNPEASS